jgi:hypothetical protein
VLSFPRLQFFWLFAFARMAPRAFPLKALNGSFQLDARSNIIVAPNHPDRRTLEAVVSHTRKTFDDLFPESVDEFPLIFKRACGHSPGLPSIVAKINAVLRRALGVGAAPYLIAGGRGEGYRLSIGRAQIDVEPHTEQPGTRKQPHA